MIVDKTSKLGAEDGYMSRVVVDWEEPATYYLELQREVYLLDHVLGYSIT